MSAKNFPFLFHLAICCLVFIGISFTTAENEIINFKGNRCLQCKQIYGDAKLNIPRRFLATPQTFEKFFLGECYEMEENLVPYWFFCYELYSNHTQVLYNSLQEKIHEDIVCSEIDYCP